MYIAKKHAVQCEIEIALQGMDSKPCKCNIFACLTHLIL